MKKTYIILIILFFGHSVSAQETTHLKISRIEQNGLIILDAERSYIKLSNKEKSSAIGTVLSNEDNNNIIVVNCGHQREMWKKDASKNKFICFDTLNINTPPLEKMIKKRPEKFAKHPWFFGGGLNWSFNDDVFNFYFNARAGFFLLLNKWDLATSFVIGVNNNNTNKIYTNFKNIGIITKFYFPINIKKQHLSPYIGGGISYTHSTTTTFESTLIDMPFTSGITMEISKDTITKTFDLPITIGINWRLGPGSLDIGAQFGFKTDFMMMAGYTFCPWINRK